MTKTRLFMIMSAASLIRRRSRLMIALLAVAMGSAILCGLITIYYDVPQQMSKSFRNYGANLIITPRSSEAGLDQNTIAEVTNLVGSADLIGITPFSYVNVRINDQPLLAAGTDFGSVLKTSPYWGIDGEIPQRSSDILIGKEVSDHLRARIGDSLDIAYYPSAGQKKEMRFKVSGIVNSGSSEEEYIYLSTASLEALTGESATIDVIECSIAVSAQKLAQIESGIAALNDNYHPRLVKRLASSEGRVLEKLQSLVYIVTVVIVLLTAVCVATTMMAVVSERRQEIGLKKALGASTPEIMREFLSQSLILGALGGILGAILGFFFAYYVSTEVFANPIEEDFTIIICTIVAAMALTAAASSIPISKASKVDPVIVLKGE